MRRLCLLAMAAIAISVPGSAMADGAPPPWLYDVFQEGQDVNIVLAIEAEWEHAYEENQVVRAGEAGSVMVVDDFFFDQHEPSEIIGMFCHPWGSYFDPEEPEPPDCEATPEKCEDCDEDGINECTGYCYYDWLYELVDECVPPGSYTYLYYVSWEGIDHDLRGQEELEVTDTGDACLDQPDDDDDDDDAAGSDDDEAAGGDDDDDDKCGGCNANSAGPAMPLFALMLLVGFATLAVNRSKG